MGFLDNLRDRLRPQDDGYYDDGYDDYYDDHNGRTAEVETSGVLGNTRRPMAESVSVYTRSGRPVDEGTNNAREAYAPSYRDNYAQREGYARRDYASDGYAQREGYARRNYDQTEYARPSDTSSSSSASTTSVLGNTTGGNTPADIGLKAIPRPSSGQLPPYVLKPVSYDDVQMVVRRVRTNQPVVLVFKNTNIETAKRILDFCFGLACGIGGQVDELADRVFIVMPEGVELSDADIDKLVADGTIER